MTERLHFQFSLSCIGEGNGNPLQYTCLENPMDKGASKATVHGVTKSRTRLSDFTRECSGASLVAQLIKNLPAMQETLGSVTGLGRSPGGGHSNPFQYSCLENPHGQKSLVGYMQSMGSQRDGHD